MVDRPETTTARGSTSDRLGLTVTINYQVPWQTIADMMVSFMESGDPVTTAAKGGWCVRVEPGQADGEQPEVAPDGEDPWYSHAEFWSSPDWRIRVIVLVDEDTGEEKVHTLGPSDFANALALLAAFNDRGDYRWAFEYIRKASTDAPTADIFMQMACFKEEVYA